MRTSWKGGPTRWVPGSTSTRCGSWYGPATPRTTRRSRCAWPPHWRPPEGPRRPPSTWAKTRSIRAARRATCSIFPASFRPPSRTARPPRRRRAGWAVPRRTPRPDGRPAAPPRGSRNPTSPDITGPGRHRSTRGARFHPLPWPFGPARFPSPMTIAHNLGFPPLGANRELKRATEGYWSGKLPRADLLKTGAELRAAHWQGQSDAGLDLIPSNDFSYYDRVLDTCALVGAVPTRYGWAGGPVDIDTYFAMARGVQSGGRDVTAMEMTKWFDTNSHYLVPEFDPGQAFRLSSSKPVDEFQEAKALGMRAKPVLIGPVTFLLLGKARTARFDRLTLLDALLPVYAEVLSRLAAAGATWVQLDEPCLALDRTPAERAVFLHAYRFLAERAPKVKLLVATYFAALDDNLPTALELPVAGLHIHAVRAGGRLEALVRAWPAGGGREGKVLSLGVIDGRNI